MLSIYIIDSKDSRATNLANKIQPKFADYNQ